MRLPVNTGTVSGGHVRNMSLGQEMLFSKELCDAFMQNSPLHGPKASKAAPRSFHTVVIVLRISYDTHRYYDRSPS